MEFVKLPLHAERVRWLGFLAFKGGVKQLLGRLLRVHRHSADTYLDANPGAYVAFFQQCP